MYSEYDRKTYDRKDTWPKETRLNGYMTERQMTEWTYGRKTSDRNTHR